MRTCETFKKAIKPIFVRMNVHAVCVNNIHQNECPTVGGKRMETLNLNHETSRTSPKSTRLL